MLQGIFAKVDTDGSGKIDRKELKTALIAFAKEKNHKITKADRQYVRKAVKHADGNGDKKLDFEEFAHFASEFMEHYKLDGGDDGSDSGSDSDDGGDDGPDM